MRSADKDHSPAGLCPASEFASKLGAQRLSSTYKAVSALLRLLRLLTISSSEELLIKHSLDRLVSKLQRLGAVRVDFILHQGLNHRHRSFLNHPLAQFLLSLYAEHSTDAQSLPGHTLEPLLRLSPPALALLTSRCQTLLQTHRVVQLTLLRANSKKALAVASGKSCWSILAAGAAPWSCGPPICSSSPCRSKGRASSTT